MSDITRDDLKVLEGRVDPIYDLSRPVTDEEFDRLAREAGYIKWSATASDGVLFITHWLESNPGKALRALLTDECDCENGIVWRSVPCEEHDHNPPLPANTSCTMSVAEEVEHEVCGGRGWIPRDGVDLIEPWEEFTNGDPEPGLFILFDWLEAEDE